MVPGKVLESFRLKLVDWSEELKEVLDEANSSGITIQVFDAKGLVAEGDASEAAPPSTSPFFRAQNFRDSMAVLARETGGALVESRNVFRADLDRVYREASSYYSVGVTLSAVPGAGARKVEVRTTRPGVVVRSRVGFGAKNAEDAAVDRIEMALLNPDAAGDFPAELRIGAAEAQGLGRRVAPYEVFFPTSELTFRDEGNAKVAVVEVTIAAIEDTGARSDVRPAKATLRIPAAEWEQAKGRPFVYRGQLKTGKGNVRFVAGVRDVASGRMALASTAIRIE